MKNIFKTEKNMTEKKSEKENSKLKKILDVIKKKWLVSRVMTSLLVLILIAAFLGLSILMHKLNLSPIDLTKEKLYTLTDESKEKVKNISKKVNIYFVGYEDSDSYLDLAKQYNNANSNINVEKIDATTRLDIAQKYSVTNEDKGIIIESGDKSKILSSNDLSSYDSSTSGYTDIAEEKLTASILTVTADYVPNVYVLSGFSSFSLSQNMKYLGMYLSNEVMNVNSLDILVKGSIPADCNLLIIPTPKQDFDELTTNSILNYINNGGNIIWFNAAYGKDLELTNVQKVLDVYGVKKFQTGCVFETDQSKTILSEQNKILPEVQSTEITSKLTNGLLFESASKINLVDSETLENLKVEESDLVKASETAFFRSDLTLTSASKTDKDESGDILLGTMLTKTLDASDVNNKKQSKLIIFSENYFISDYAVSDSSNSTPYIFIYNNKDLVINAASNLTNVKQDVSIRKNIVTVTYTATAQQDTIIRIIIFAVPGLIIIMGIIIAQFRKRKGNGKKAQKAYSKVVDKDENSVEIIQKNDETNK